MIQILRDEREGLGWHGWPHVTCATLSGLWRRTTQSVKGAGKELVAGRMEEVEREGIRKLCLRVANRLVCLV